MMNKKFVQLLVSATSLLPLSVAAQQPANTNAPNREPAKQQFLEMLDAITGNKYEIKAEDTPCLGCGGTAFSVTNKDGMRNIAYRFIYSKTQERDSIIDEKDSVITLDEIPAIYGGQIDGLPAAIFKQPTCYVVTKILPPGALIDKNIYAYARNLPEALQYTNPDSALSRLPPTPPAGEPAPETLFFDYAPTIIPDFESYSDVERTVDPKTGLTSEVSHRNERVNGVYYSESIKVTGMDGDHNGLSVSEVTSIEYKKKTGRNSTATSTAIPTFGSAFNFGFNKFSLTDLKTPYIATAIQELMKNRLQ
jgi:hypothetical protein